MIKNPYLKGKKAISRLGFGAWPLGNTAHGQTMSETEGISLVRAAYDAGVTFYDTAPNYANGRSETILGHALKGIRDHVVINTKFGHHSDGSIDFNETRLRASVEGSLTRLQTSYMDSVILHNPDQAILEGKTGHFDELARLKTAGRILGYGVSIDSPAELKLALRRDDIEVIELLFNVFSQAPRTMFEEVKKRNISLIIKVPLDSGWLTGKYHKDMTFTDIRSRWTQHDKCRRHNLVEKMKTLTQDDALVKYALGFIWSYDAITTVIPGIRTSHQLKEHLHAEAFPFPCELKQALETFYETDIKPAPLPW